MREPTMMTGGKFDGAPGNVWEDAASRLRTAGPGKELDGACRRLVDELEGTAGTGERCLEGATRALSALLPDLGHGARARVLAEAVGRVYAAPGNRGALGGLFGAIFESLDGDARTYAALEAVRAALLRVYVGADEPGDSAGDVLGACYGALARVASDSRLGELSRRMEGADARAAACEGRSAMAHMARLWRFVYDMRDVPGDEGIRIALKRHAILNSLSSNRRLKAAKARVSQLVLHIAEDHAMHEDYETIYTVMRESNMRIQYWLDEIYRQHGVRRDTYLTDRMPKSVFHKPSLGWLHLAMAVRYLILELDGFRLLERTAYKKIVRRLDVVNPNVLYKIIDRRENVEKSVRCLRNSFGAHIDWTFNRTKEEVDRIGLAYIVRHAKKVLMFQDSAYRAIPHKYYGSDPWSRALVTFDPLQGNSDRLAKIAKKYEKVSIKLNIKHVEQWHAMHESFMCLYLTYGKYLERLNGNNNTMDEIILTTSEVYNIKYMFLELGNITKELADVGLDMPFEPEFASRQKEYWHLRGDYAAHLHKNNITSLAQVLESKKELLSHLPYDIEEIFQVMTKLENALPEGRTYEISHMTESEIKDIEAELNKLKETTHAAFGNRFLDPHAEQKLHDAKERFKSLHGLEGGGSRRAQAGHGEETGGFTGREPASPLREAEAALEKTGLKNCPEGWIDDLVFGDHAGALARMRVHAELSGEVEATPAGSMGWEGRPDMEVGTRDGRLWISVCSLDNMPRMLGGARHEAGARRAISHDILEIARTCFAGMGTCTDQVALVVMDPDGAIADHGGLELALEAVGREMPWVGALAVAGRGGCEVWGVPRARVKLGEQARSMLRALSTLAAGPDAPAEPGHAARDQA